LPDGCFAGVTTRLMAFRQRRCAGHYNPEYGHLETPALTDFRSRVREVDIPKGTLKLSEVVGDVQQIHLAPENAGALFQVASQFGIPYGKWALR
ncbi:MAG: hypothetical protein ABGZ53_32355, partial [Fuerstiella sp.]